MPIASAKPPPMPIRYGPVSAASAKHASIAIRSPGSDSVPVRNACSSSGCSATSGWRRSSSWLSLKTPPTWISQLARKPTRIGSGAKTWSRQASPMPTKTGAEAVGKVWLGYSSSRSQMSRALSAPRAGPLPGPPPEGVEELGSGPSFLESAAGCVMVPGSGMAAAVGAGQRAGQDADRANAVSLARPAPTQRLIGLAVGLARVAAERGDEAEAYRLSVAALELDPQNATAVR